MQAKVYANSDDTLVVWKVDAPIPDCRGFAIYRRRGGSQKLELLSNRVGWDEDDKLREAPSTKWPIQRFTWTDYKARAGEVVSYRIVPMVGDRNQLRPNEELASPWTAEITLRPDGHNGIAAFFNRGIVASQWLSRVLGEGESSVRQRKLREIIEDPGDRTRGFLGGELRAAMLRLLGDARKRKVDVYAALYELDDPELTDALVALGKKAHVVLANGSTKKKTKDPNKAAREALREAGAEVHDRMTAPRHLAHNKFLVVTDDAGVPQQVWTGSTNWSKTGLCTQGNNGILFTHPKLAAVFHTQWEQLRDAESSFDRAALAEINSKSEEIKDDGRSYKVWFTPVNDEADLDEARELIEGAKRGILFAMFNPGPRGTLLNAITKRRGDPTLIVQGIVNQDPANPNDEEDEEQVQIFRNKQKTLKGSFQIALPAAIDKRVSFWIPELKKLNGTWAMVHSKVIVIDPFGPEPALITGSHNLGPKASRANDDNMVIIRGDSELTAAYAVNILGIYASYRWRWNRIHSDHARAFTKLQDDDKWQKGYLSGDRLRELNFWLGI